MTMTCYGGGVGGWGVGGGFGKKTIRLYDFLCILSRNTLCWGHSNMMLYTMDEVVGFPCYELYDIYEKRGDWGSIIMTFYDIWGGGLQQRQSHI